MAWTEKTRQSETWAPNQRRIPGDGFAVGFGPRPAFAIALRAGIWEPKAEQPETWAAS